MSALLLESVYQSKAGLNETQRDANVTVLLIDQWSVVGAGEKKKREGGFRIISANALNLETRFHFDGERQRSRLHNRNGRNKREDGEFVRTLGRSPGTNAQKYTDVCRIS